MAQIAPLTESPAAFAPLAAKINEIIAELNARDLEAGAGLSLTRSDMRTIISLNALTATGVCNLEGGIDITIEGD